MNKNLLRIVFLFIIVSISSSTLLAQKQNVNVTEFTVSAKEHKVMIDWKTDGVTPTNYFAIQKSSDGINFKTVALVLGPDPRQKNCDCFGCFDKTISKTEKRSYYRLVHIDTNGNEQITEAKVLATP